ncbi:thioesterase II family protein [Niveispirillum irakense]|uniref:thioesterase II family protein n=1 Tax=Niveispirillum irakense TaxID=34011 RepID=UPI00048C492D|nr:alpha/beta fold hydrolase [Niveispirillum irakense]
MTPTPLWLVRPQPRPEADIRLFCFHHAGGGAAFFVPWAAELPRHVELIAIRLPGREAAYGAPRCADPAQVVDGVRAAMAPLLDRPFALFGHSLGALLAYRTALSLVAEGAGAPTHLFCSAFRAPHLPLSRAPLSGLAQADLLEELDRHGGIPAAVRAHEELLSLILPVLRDDLALAEGYQHDNAPPLNCPLTALGGQEDGLVSAAELAGWADHTTGPFRRLIYPGGHFYLSDHRPRLIADIVAGL